MLVTTAAKVHIFRHQQGCISRSLGCKNACKGVQSVPVLCRDSQWQEDHEAGPVGAPGHLPARPVAQKVPPPTRHTHMIPNIGMHGYIGICRLHIDIYLCETLKSGVISYQISVYTDIERAKSTISSEIS